MTKPKKVPYGRCPHCGYWRRLVKGAMPVHNDFRDTSADPTIDYCAGSGQKPKRWQLS